MTITETAPVTATDLGFDVKPRDLAAALTSVLPFAGSDMTLPMLCAVHFERIDGVLTLATTDRYTVGSYRIEEAGGSDVDALLPTSAAKDLLRFAKGLPKHLQDHPGRLTFEGEFLTFEQFGSKVTLLLDRDHQFVKWQVILSGAKRNAESARDRVGTIGLNPAYLAKFAKVVAERHAPMRLTLNESALKPAIVEIGDNFTGLIMPVRLDRN